MSPAPITRRSLMAAAGAALGAVALPAGITRALAAETPPAALPLAFDARAYVDDLLAAGCRVWLHQPMPLGYGEPVDPPFVWITPPRGQGSAAAYGAVMARWADAMDACPDHIERVVAHMIERTEP